ncbi:PAQR family membrane homeostasis protein TrhA [Criibacterium bergeronii]|nr:hemolysin III family protein [Criibacterium bergeronii]MBS6063091.1 hemolysin III family protein [Peptostreptococcaceae bacterium]
MMKTYEFDAKSLVIETFNTLSHFAGVVLGIVFLTLMINKSLLIGSKNLPSFIVYGAFFILMFLTSTIYHATFNKKIKAFARIFDHTAIFLFIAGSYTPVITSIFSGNMRILLLCSIWLLALGGTIFKIITHNSYDKYKKISVILYIAMGWFAIIIFKPLLLEKSVKFIILLVLGGLLYTVGTIFYKSKNPVYHIVWHFFVLGAAIIHFFSYYFYLIS